MQSILSSQGLPSDLVYLAMVESGFSNRALSSASALGVWQFMPQTACTYGLVINDFVDQRLDTVKATWAAAAYLTSLYTMFGDWHLATAGYNAGESKVSRNLSRWSLSSFVGLSNARRLPLQTRQYVPKFLAALIVAKNLKTFGFQTKDVWEDPFAKPFETVPVRRFVVLSQLAQEAGIEPGVLESLNPELRWHITPVCHPNSSYQAYPLKVPVGFSDAVRGALFRVSSAQLQQSFCLMNRKTRRAEAFAKALDIPFSAIRSQNPAITRHTFLRRGKMVWVRVKLGDGMLTRMVLASRAPIRMR